MHVPQVLDTQHSKLNSPSFLPSCSPSVIPVIAHATTIQARQKTKLFFIDSLLFIQLSNLKNYHFLFILMPFE